MKYLNILLAVLLISAIFCSFYFFTKVSISIFLTYKIVEYINKNRSHGG